MSRCYIFHGDQVTEYPAPLPDGTKFNEGAVLYEPYGQPQNLWWNIALQDDGQIMYAPKSITNVPTLYLTMALLLT